jgi:nicotinamidase-related amidase
MTDNQYNALPQSTQSPAAADRLGAHVVHEVQLQTGEVLDPRIAELLNPKETAILVVDVMSGYCDPNAPLPQFCNATTTALDQAADRMVTFLDASRKLPMASTIFIRMLERPETVPANIRTKMEIDASPPVAELNGAGWDYYKVKALDGDPQIVKHNYDSFEGTELDAILQEKGVKTVIIIGAYASVCVDETARNAAKRGYNTFVPADLTADLDTSDGALQTPEAMRIKLHAIENVLGYMPLASNVLAALKSNATSATS